MNARDHNTVGGRRRPAGRRLKSALVRRRTEIITRDMFADGVEDDYEGLNCDWCGLPMHVGGTRWVYELGRKEGTWDTAHRWCFCCPDCAEYGRIEIGTVRNRGVQ